MNWESILGGPLSEVMGNTCTVQGIAWDKKWDGELGQASLNYQLSMGDTVARPDAAHAVQRTRVS